MKKSLSDCIWDWFKAFLVAFLIALSIRYFVLIPLKVVGDSMSPTLEPDTYILYSKNKKVDRFDIVLFHDANNQVFIKRVIGLPGETIVYQDDQLFINDKKVSEPFLHNDLDEEQVFTTDFPLSEDLDNNKIPVDSYFVLGDNRPRSKDSRMLGFIPIEAIEGQARLVIYPLNRFSILD
ncbi:signal peptidase I [Jeotgalibaca dankookensis]|uniref:signal peptidase I n=1 Tax=Jeotgalibaca dankookensis TaxID=708126 RepID=UPI000782A250|nr:signal peptidase I [Jeotgalibaca dankookensis]